MLKNVIVQKTRFSEKQFVPRRDVVLKASELFQSLFEVTGLFEDEEEDKQQQVGCNLTGY